MASVTSATAMRSHGRVSCPAVLDRIAAMTAAMTMTPL